MKNLKVSTKLMVSYAFMVLLVVVVGLIAIGSMKSMNQADDDLYQHNLLAISAIGEIRENIQAQRVQLLDIVANAGNIGEIQSAHSIMTQLEREIEPLFINYENTISDEADEAAYMEAKKAYQNDFAATKERVMEASFLDFQTAHDELYSNRVTTVVDTMVNGFTQAMNLNGQWAIETINTNTALFHKMILVEIICILIALVIAIFFAYYISGLISKPLSLMAIFFKKAGLTGNLTLNKQEEDCMRTLADNKDEIGELSNSAYAFIGRILEVSDKLELVANGDLTVDIKLLSEEDKIGGSMLQMIGSLNDMFGSIHNTTVQVATGSKYVADGAQSLAEGSTEQAASIEELSSSIADIAVRTKDNAEIADKTSKLSITIKENAEKGSRQMDDMIAAVKDINDASQSISKIIKTIDDIAFQTNILALNAAVEAARAGEHGKGFAVVAEEVRNLASKSAEAAKDTGNMIQDSIEKAELGYRIAGSTAESLREIVSGINESSLLAMETARAYEEQSVGIEQINAGIDQVAQVVQQNSATAEESAATSQEMSSHATVLEDMISQFKLRKA